MNRPESRATSRAPLLKSGVPGRPNDLTETIRCCGAVPLIWVT